ncbi:uncharacterized protein LOC127547416 [Antechinus flavipes]|uniref:uncharacterized protein LOC127547416 n=1 Tax=Antechinus flavipes TaxID=38775 RepID=UPI002235E785|nr:uncharacterized protein LOC127547416 [Antechinus flavipes]
MSGAARLSDGSPPPLARSRRCLRPLSVQRSRLRLPFFSLLPLHRHLAAFALVPARPARCLVGCRRLRPRLAPFPTRRAALSLSPWPPCLRGSPFIVLPPLHSRGLPRLPSLHLSRGMGEGGPLAGCLCLFTSLLPSPLPPSSAWIFSNFPAPPHPHPLFPSRRLPGALRGNRGKGLGSQPCGVPANGGPDNILFSVGWLFLW